MFLLENGWGYEVLDKKGKVKCKKIVIKGGMEFTAGAVEKEDMKHWERKKFRRNFWLGDLES